MVEKIERGGALARYNDNWCSCQLTTSSIGRCLHTFSGNRDVQIDQSVLTAGHQVHVHWKVVFSVAERLDAPEAQALGCFQKRSHDAGVEIFHEKEVQLPAISPSQDLVSFGCETGTLEGGKRNIVEVGELLHDLEHLTVRN